jgi:dihydroorotase
MYAEVFDGVAPGQAGSLCLLQRRRFYGLPRNTDTITLVKEAGRRRELCIRRRAQLKPLRFGEALPWKMLD